MTNASDPPSKKNGSLFPENDFRSSFSLLDEATAKITPIASELAVQRDIAADPSIPLVKRLEAFEDVFDSEIGDTPTSRARNIEREFGLRQIFLKFEGANPTGTQKDRIAFAQSMDALRRGFDGITLATCGNYGVAMSFAASIAGLKCHVFIPESYKTKREKEIQEFGADIIKVPGDYESAVLDSRKFAESREVYDANPGGANTAIQLKAYGEISNEIYDELRDAPGYVAVPVSNGTTLAGIYKGFVSLYRRGKTSKIPKIIAGSSFGKNPIIHAFLKNIQQCTDLRPETIKETHVNEPLINWQSIDGDLALEAVRATGGWAAYASDKNMMEFSKLLRGKEGLNALPASTAGLLALLGRHKKVSLDNDRFVIVLTGRK